MLEIYCEKYQKTIKTALKSALNYFNIKEENIEVEADFLSEEEIKALNGESRGVDAVTDVLSFPNCEIKLPFNKKDYLSDLNPETNAVMLGEVYICLERALEQAKDYNHSTEREIAFLSVHGFLHLLGFDHGNKVDAEEMERAQEEILQTAGFLREMRRMRNEANEANCGFYLN